MKRPVIVLGLDATAPALLERWLDEGKLPVIAGLRSRGGFGYINNIDHYRTETSWENFLTGVLPQQTGEWGHMHFLPEEYRTREQSAYSFERYPPFYANSGSHRVAVFDPPLARPVAGVNGIQVMGWGTEVNQCLRLSKPESLIRELSARHGHHPLLESSPGIQGEGGEEVFSYTIPSAYDMESLLRLADKLRLGVKRRTAIIKDLLGRENWDLFLGVFSETHTSSHLLWHLSQTHPLNARLTPPDDPLLRVYQAVDTAIGEIMEVSPPDARVLLFSIYGIGPNVLDLPSMAFLPELLYRWNVPGKTALGIPQESGQVPPPTVNHPGHWRDEMWSLRSENGDKLLESPREQEAQGDPLHWQPANWYRPLWSGMRAFALPTYSEGLIRVNVAGRDGKGMVAPDGFPSVCDEICDYLSQIRDSRSGLPMVKKIIRTRKTAFDQLDTGPPADLIVLWQEETPTDVIDHPQAGQMGPWPYFRTGGHCSQGFVMASGPGFEPGSKLPEMHAVEFTAMLKGMIAETETCVKPDQE